MDIQKSENTLFNDVHSFLHNVTADLAHLKKVAIHHDEERQQDLEAHRKRAEAERYESREEINKFRYEYDELVHRKVERVIEAIEDMQRAEKKDDILQQEQIDGVRKDLLKLKVNLSNVNAQWLRFKSAGGPRTSVVRANLANMQDR